MMSKSALKTSRGPSPFCATCKNAGKSESEYRSHFTKSNAGPTGVVICPTILAFVCSNCKNSGHVAKYCKQTSVKVVASVVSPLERKKNACAADAFMKQLSANKFSVLDSDSSDSSDSEVEKPVVQKPVVQKPAKLSYKNILEKPVVDYSSDLKLSADPDGCGNFRVLVAGKSGMEAARNLGLNLRVSVMSKRRRWADDVSSSEGEDDFSF